MQLRGKDKQNKKSGILLSLTSLPSEYGIGSLGKEAFRFIDFLKETNQSLWQILPTVPIGKGNSPYSSESAFAGEILLIDIDLLIAEGLISKEDIKRIDFPQNVSYDSVRNFKLPLLKKAAAGFNTKNREFKAFKEANSFWLKDYALFKTIKYHYSQAKFQSWDEALKYRLPSAAEDFKDRHIEEISFYEITQFLFFKQYKAFLNYANKNGIKIIGDIPFYVSLDSADVWSHPECFKLGRDLTPLLEAGVPPDIFSEIGQLWGNPIYDWEYQKKNEFLWWRSRLTHTATLCDIIRIDHFRAFADYYTIPAGAKNAVMGKWEKGVGMGFWGKMRDITQKTQIIAEDLGGDTDEVRDLIRATGFPNMKLLQFAFSSDLKNQFLPKNYNSNCICYTGTHDNDTTLGWYNSASKKEKLMFRHLVPKDKSGSPVLSLILYGMKSKANTVIVPLQDYMELDSNARLNTPGVPFSNWEWRFKKEDLNEELKEKIIRLTKGRN